MLVLMAVKLANHSLIMGTITPLQALECCEVQVIFENSSDRRIQ